MTRNPYIKTLDGSQSMHHAEHGELYHSSEGALWQANELYLKCSGAKVAMLQKQDFFILDVGLGLAYNALSTIQGWHEIESKANVTLVSLEIDRELFFYLGKQSELWNHKSASLWQDWFSLLSEKSDGTYAASFLHPKTGATLAWTVYLGDAEESLTKFADEPRWQVIYQDPFSPQKNPSLWTLEWFTKLARQSKPEATLVSYSVASQVRANLSQAGFSVEKIPTPGVKKHWLRASFPSK